MGKGKGGFDHWAARVAVNQVVFEVKGLVHEAVVKDAFRLAGNKLPGMFGPTLNLGSRANENIRPMGVRAEGRASCRRHHQAGRCDSGGAEATEEKD